MPSMKLFASREEASDAVNTALSRYPDREGYPVDKARLATATDTHNDRFQTYSFILEAANGENSLLRVRPPVLYDVLAKGNRVVAPVLHMAHDMFIEKTQRPVPKEKQTPRGPKTESLYSAPIIWPDRNQGPTTTGLGVYRTPGTGRPEAVRERFFDTRLAVLPAEISVGEKLEMYLYPPEAFPLENTHGYYGSSKEHVVRIDGHEPQRVRLGTTVGISLHIPQDY